MLQELRASGHRRCQYGPAEHGLQAYVQVDRATASRFGISPQLMDNVLYDAFGERQVSTMYTPLNQYHVVMAVQKQFWQNPLFLRDLYAYAPNGQDVPLSAISQYDPTLHRSP